MQASAVAAVAAVEVPRDRWGKPLIIPVGGGKPIAYNRASSFGDVLDDRSNLEKWKTRMAVKGLSLRPDLLLSASATPLENKQALNKIAEQAIEHAGGSTASTIGSALHSLTEQLDRGETIGVIPEQYLADLEAYRLKAMHFTFLHIERFMVCDELKVAGTPDRLGVQILPLPTQRDDDYAYEETVVTDLKTGGSSGFLDKHASQLAIYAHSDLYDAQSGARTPVVVNQDYGYLFHMAAGSGECNIYRLDLRAGWEAALLAADVRAFRKRKGTCVPA